MSSDILSSSRGIAGLAADPATHLTFTTQLAAPGRHRARNARPCRGQGWWPEHQRRRWQRWPDLPRCAHLDLRQSAAR